jgi:hypothetical protein
MGSSIDLGSGRAFKLSMELSGDLRAELLRSDSLSSIDTIFTLHFLLQMTVTRPVLMCASHQQRQE